MRDADLPAVLAEVRRLRSRFAATAPRQWDPATAAAELSVQVGHVAVCLLPRLAPGVRVPTDPQRPITDPGDELADVVLAALSVAVLAPARHRPSLGVVDVDDPSSDIEGFLRLVIAAGALSEAAMIEQGYRHHPTGRVPTSAQAAAEVVAACDALSRHLALDLLTEFRSMVADADAFLDSRGLP